MNIKYFKEYAALRLGRQYKTPELQFFIGSLLEGIAGIPRYAYYTREEDVLDNQQRKALLFAVDQAAAGKPLQYILGSVVFGNCRIKVDKRVLIPRPETEELWSRASKIAGRVLDAGTGSGCLAIALKKERPDYDVFAFDSSAGALDLAKENAVLNNVEVYFFHARMENDDGQETTEGTEKAGKVETAAAQVGLEAETVDLLVSNPPYVTEKEKEQMLHRVLAFEPAEALFVPNEDPLVHFRALASLGVRFLRPRGVLLAEINEAYGSDVGQLFEERGYTQVQIHKDLHKKDRFVQAEKRQ